MKKTNRNTSAKTSAAKTKAVENTISTSVTTPTQPVQAATVVQSTKQATKRPATSLVSFELESPQANNVCVAGTFNGWRPETTPLQKTPGGRWVRDLTVPPGRHEYLFVVDGQWTPDPKARETVENPFGGKNSVLSVSA